jgi:hypothetical protein
MTDKANPKSTGKRFLAFLNTLPGIIAAVATLITAIGGLIIVLNKTGCMNSTSDHQRNELAVDSAADSVLPDSPSLNDRKVSYSLAEVKHITRNLAYKIKEADVEKLPDNKIVLLLKIKCVNDSEYEYNFYAKYIRVKIGEDSYPPEPYSKSNGYEAVPAKGFMDLEYNYKLPAGTKNFSLVFYDENDEIGSSSFVLK